MGEVPSDNYALPTGRQSAEGSDTGTKVKTEPEADRCRELDPEEDKMSVASTEMTAYSFRPESSAPTLDLHTAPDQQSMHDDTVMPTATGPASSSGAVSPTVRQRSPGDRERPGVIAAVDLNSDSDDNRMD